MLPDAIRPGGFALPSWRDLPGHWRAPLVRLAVVWIALIAAFLGDWRDMAVQWWDSSTYNHILLVPAIIGWLVWQRAPQLARLAPRLWWPGLVLFGAAAFIWVLGAFAGFNLARQIGAVAMLGTAAMALLGPRVSAALAFPLAYLAVLVPFGDELVPTLQMITADITIALVHLSGIPAVIDGVFIDTPAGLFEVAEACSGVKFLIAMWAFGLLVSNVCFISWKRRLLFMALCTVVPVLANGVRAWATVYAAQYVGAAAATGFDHIVYGWFFFAFVIVMVMAMAWRFFDRPADSDMIDVAAIEASPLLARFEQMTVRGGVALAIIAALAGGAHLWAASADRLHAPMPARIALPAVPGWQRVPYVPAHDWHPRADGAAHHLLGRYADGKGHQVDVFFALYPAQRDGMEAGGYGQGALPPDGVWSWQAPGPATAQAKSDRLLAAGRFGRVAQTYYRTGPLLTGHNWELKLATIADRLLLRQRPTMMLILATEETADSDSAAALDAFRAAIGPVDQWMDRVATLR